MRYVAKTDLSRSMVLSLLLNSCGYKRLTCSNAAFIIATRTNECLIQLNIDIYAINQSRFHRMNNNNKCNELQSKKKREKRKETLQIRRHAPVHCEEILRELELPPRTSISSTRIGSLQTKKVSRNSIAQVIHCTPCPLQLVHRTCRNYK
jgi:hypothetical protein